MLGPAFETKPSADTIVNTAEPDLIERASADKRPPLLRNRGIGTAPKPIVSPTSYGGRTTTQTLHIDLARLKKLNILTPDGGRSPIGESFRRVKRHVFANLASAEPDVPGNLIMVTSP